MQIQNNNHILTYLHTLHDVYYITLHKKKILHTKGQQAEDNKTLEGKLLWKPLNRRKTVEEREDNNIIN